MLEFLCERFPHIPRTKWLERMRGGLVRYESGAAIDPTTACRPERILYFREVEEEPRVIPEIEIRLQTETVLVADKPAGIPVVPSGRWVRESLLYRMIERTGDETLQPVHRIDRDTTGLVLFARGGKEIRARYHRLFVAGEVTKVYRAIAALELVRGCGESGRRYWRLVTRIVPDAPWFRRRSVPDGVPNAISDVYLEKIQHGRAWFRVLIETGKQHQVRVHLASIGFPIVGDRLYPELQNAAAGSGPLQLLASEIGFRDPFAGTRVWVTSRFELPLAGGVDANP